MSSEPVGGENFIRAIGGGTGRPSAELVLGRNWSNDPVVLEGRGSCMRMQIWLPIHIGKSPDQAESSHLSYVTYDR